MQVVLLIAIALSAAITIGSEYTGWRRGVYIFKPLTTSLIILLALLADTDNGSYQTLIIVGLVFSLGGDVFLMWPEDRFVLGLVSFLIAHIFYIIAFATDADGGLNWSPLLPLVIFGGFMLWILWPGLGSMKGPVVAYMAAILVMGWLALSRWQGTDRPGVALAGIGAVLFIISDSILAVDRFRTKFLAARLLVLSTYFTAQTLIALSIEG